MRNLDKRGAAESINSVRLQKVDVLFGSNLGFRCRSVNCIMRTRACPPCCAAALLLKCCARFGSACWVSSRKPVSFGPGACTTTCSRVLFLPFWHVAKKERLFPSLHRLESPMADKKKPERIYRVGDVSA